FGAEKLVAMVHTVAYANFQDRIIMALGVAVEPNGPLPPPDLRLDPEKRTKVPTPPRPPWDHVILVQSSAEIVPPLDWHDLAPADLGKCVDRQKERKPRVPLPGSERLADLAPAEKDSASRIVWTRVGMGYQPQMTRTWFDCMRTYQKESQLDEVFDNAVFWVITRTSDCF